MVKEQQKSLLPQNPKEERHLGSEPTGKNAAEMEPGEPEQSHGTHGPLESLVTWVQGK